MWRYCIVCLLAMAGSVEVLAQNVVFIAEVAANKLGIQDQMELVYIVQNATNLRSINPPAALQKDFQVVGGPYQSTNSSVSIVNGKMMQSSSIRITYVIRPKQLGNFSLPPAIAKDADGHTFQSNPLNIQVVKGSLAAQQQQQQQRNAYDPWGDDPFEAIQRQRQQQLQAMRRQMQQQQQAPEPANIDLSKDLFIRVTVDKSKVRVGEQITATYKLYSRVPMQVNISKLPSLNGFWTQDFELPKANIKPTKEMVDGKPYQVFILKKSALFPQQTGNLELDPAEAEGIARVMVQQRRTSSFADMFDDPAIQNFFGSLMMNDPFFNDDFFGGMAYKDVKVHLKSTPVKITVTQVPEEGKPTDYGGAVGNFNITASIDKTSLTTDDVANLKLTITGSGNLKLIEAPKLNLPNGLTSLDPLIVDTVTGRSTTISGSKIITYPITPNNEGDYTIPPASFSYFNAATGKYATLQTQPIKLNVKQGKGGRQDKGGLALTDIHGIDKKPLKELTYNSKPLFFTVGYWSMYAAPLMAFVAVAFWRRREDEELRDVAGTRSKRANKIALKRLATAQKLLQGNNEKAFYDEVSKAIWLYLSDKLSIPLSELSHEKAQEVFTARKVPQALQQKAQAVINQCETALYAGYTGSRQMNETYNDAVDIISKLEESFKA